MDRSGQNGGTSWTSRSRRWARGRARKAGDEWRLGDPGEIAAAALLLASDAATFVSGAEWFVDGGRIGV
ncbi:SDR family oxidoreductase [Motilibacter aurantiacus]|uniref:SDR family oxidoreductase n=1 Tax=Motilibacter aurantiacus TaxID=2714955 RepID=UPI0018C8BCBF